MQLVNKGMFLFFFFHKEEKIDEGFYLDTFISFAN